jgi:hypothetical protein
MKLFRRCHFCLKLHAPPQGKMKLGETLCANGMQLKIRKKGGITMMAKRCLCHHLKTLLCPERTSPYSSAFGALHSKMASI